MALNGLRRILTATSTPANARNVFSKQEICNKNPFELFRNWYRDASLGGTRCGKYMFLTTVSKNNTPACKVIKCIEPTEEGLKFAISEFSVTKADLLENTNVSVAFLWPNQRAVRIEGLAKELQEARDEYIKNEQYHNRIVAICSKFHKLLPGRTALEKTVEELKAKYPPNSEIPPHVCVYILVPNRFEFYYCRENEGISRLKFEKGLKVDNKYVYPGKEGWTYSILSP